MPTAISFVTCLALVAAAVRPARADVRTMHDVQALAQRHAWRELLDTAAHVAPAARDADWEPLVRTAAANVVDGIARSSASDLRAANQLVEVVPGAERTYAFLTGDRRYVEAKGRALARVAAACTDGDLDGCGTVIEQLADGVQHFPPGTARAIAVLLSEDEMPSQTIRFWALAADDDAAACRDGRLAHAVIDVLDGAGSGAPLAAAQRAAARCYAALEPALVRELEASDPAAKPPFLRNACPVLKTHGARTVLKKKKCS